MGLSKGRHFNTNVGKSVLKVYTNTKLLNETLDPVIETNVAINKNNKINVNTNIQGSVGKGIKNSISVVKTKRIPLIDTSKLLTS